MTLLIVSVRDPAEAELALAGGADIIDLKAPDRGALGALPSTTISACVKRVGARAPVSATIGDRALDDDDVIDAVRRTAALGVDYVKLGVFPGEGAEVLLRRLEPAAAEIRLILVLFADAMPNFDAVALAGEIGAHGVMFDTRGKRAGALPDHISYIGLAGHIAAAKAEGLILGLAGSLKAKHVPSLLALEPDLLGFRGAFCHGGDRANALDPARLASIRALVEPNPRSLRVPHLPDLAPEALC
jgi:uncharacterized protein (UPF0264 family)